MQVPSRPLSCTLLMLVTASVASCSRDRDRDLGVNQARQALTSTRCGAIIPKLSEGVIMSPDGPQDFLNAQILNHPEFPADGCTLSGILEFLVNGTDGNGTIPGTGSMQGVSFRCEAKTAFISETAQILHKIFGPEAVQSASYRAVTAATCRELGPDGNPVFDTGPQDPSQPEFSMLFSGLNSSPRAVLNRERSPELDEKCIAELAEAYVSTEQSPSLFQIRSCSDGAFMALCDSADFDATFAQSLQQAEVDDTGEQSGLENLAPEVLRKVLSADFCFASDENDFSRPRPCFQSTVDALGLDAGVVVDSTQARCYKGVGVDVLDGAPTEIMAFDEVNGVFNFYIAGTDPSAPSEGNRMHFFGSSADSDALLEDADSNREAAQILADLDDHGLFGGGRCAACHPGGGMVMKELRTPWLHWEGNTTTPGAGAIRAARPEIYGKQPFFTGIDLESLTDQANRAVASARIDRLVAQGRARALARPLFCPTEFNLNSMGAVGLRGDGASPPSQDNRMFIPLASFLNTAGTFLSGGPQIDREAYEAVREDLDQTLPLLTDTVVNDTFFEGTFVEPSGYDRAYMGVDSEFASTEPFFSHSLVGKGLIHSSWIKAIQAVDPTRPVTSELRCSLLGAIPDAIERGEGTDGTTELEATILQGMSVACQSSADPEVKNAACDLAERLRQMSQPLTRIATGSPQTVGEARVHLSLTASADACALRSLAEEAGIKGLPFARDLFTVVHDSLNTLNRATGTSPETTFPIIEFPLGVTFARAVTTAFGQQFLDPRDCSLRSEGDGGSVAVFGDHDFCESLPEGRFGAWCYDSTLTSDLLPDPGLWGSVVERPASNTWVFCGQGDTAGQLTGIDTQCFSGCRRMADGFADECQPSLSPGFELCQGPDFVVHVNSDGSPVSFCDDPETTAGKDRLACQPFGGSSRLWCKTSCSGAHLAPSGDVVDDGGNVLIRADGTRVFAGDIVGTCQ